MNNKFLLNPLFPFHINEITINNKEFLKINNSFQVLYLKEGQIEFSDVIINERSVIFLYPDDFQFITKVNNINIVHIIFNLNFVNSLKLTEHETTMLEEMNILFNINFKNFEDKIIFFTPDKIINIEINHIFSKLLIEFQQKKLNYHFIIRIKILELFIILHRLAKQKDIIQYAKNDINWVIDYINKNYSEDLALKDFALNTGFNPSYLSRIFKEKTGKSLFEYINVLRIEKACLLLKNTELPVIEISMMVGFNNLSFFNRYFKKLMNISPRDYRRNFKK